MIPIYNYLTEETLPAEKEKARVVRRKSGRSKDWIEELPHVLWAHRTMIKSRNGDTPFSLTYGKEAIILAEIGMPTMRTAEVDMVQKDEALSNDASYAKESGKRSPKWEGPYEVTEALAVAGTPEVLALPTKFLADSGSMRGTKASEIDRC
ncbi:reverse transcriptase domain-containing protein [Tanacetum coccineum]